MKPRAFVAVLCVVMATLAGCTFSGRAEPETGRVLIGAAGLSLEVPAAWTEVQPQVWASPADDALRLGVRWADLQPPQEAEAALLPQPSLVLDSTAVDTALGGGRRMTLEVYEEASPGGGLAPVRAVETHVLVVRQQGGRRAFDVYVSAPDAGQLAGLDAILQQALASVAFE